jgi:hypothetical protein
VDKEVFVELKKIESSFILFKKEIEALKALNSGQVKSNTPGPTSNAGEGSNDLGLVNGNKYRLYDVSNLIL